MPNEVKLQPNIPLQLALQDPAGVPDGFRVHYQTTDGRTLTLPRPVAIELNELDLRPAESFVICRYRNPEGYSSLKVWLTAATEQQRALIEIATDDPTMTVPPQPETPGRVSGLKRKKTKSQDQPRLFDRGTGTYGPALRPLADSQPLTALSRIGGPIPMDLAFRQILGFVTDALNDCSASGSGPFSQCAGERGAPMPERPTPQQLREVEAGRERERELIAEAEEAAHLARWRRRQLEASRPAGHARATGAGRSAGGTS